jgi:hypothetical protein
MPTYLTRKEAAEYLRIPEHSLQRKDTRTRAIPYSIVGGKALYTLADLDAWVAAHRVEPVVDSPLVVELTGRRTFGGQR